MMKKILYTLILLLSFCSSTLAADFYIAQSAAGDASGSSCANAHALSGLTWGTGNDVEAGDTLHLCGTITSQLVVGASGSSGNIITIVFEDDAVMSAAYWGATGAIYMTGRSYIKVDGGTNGIIENTANGTALANQQASAGVRLVSPTNVEITNLTVQNIYVNGGSDSGATDIAGRLSYSIHVTGAITDLSIHDNTITASRIGINVDFDESQNINIYNNTVSDHAWGISVAEGDGGVTATGVNIYNNTITNWTNWQYPTATYHTNGIIVYCKSNSTYAPKIYNNYIYGNLGSGSPTAMIFCTYGESAPGATCSIYNNLLVSTNNSYAIWLQSGRNNTIYNNTIIGNTNASGTAIMWGTVDTGTCTFKNNIIKSWRYAIASQYVTLENQVVATNNLYYDIASGPTANWFMDTADYMTITEWKAMGGNPDADMLTVDPSLDVTYKPDAADDPVVGAGYNLSAYFTTDKSGATRSVPWDIGAYEYTTGVTTHTLTVAKSGTGATMTTGEQTVEDGAEYSISVTRHNGWNGAWSTSDGTNCVVSGCSVPAEGATGTCSVTVNADCTVTYTATEIKLLPW